MAKRSSGFERAERDYYPTPRKPIEKLLPHLARGTRFVEPCAGDGRLADVLVEAGHVCLKMFDVEPRREDISSGDALSVSPGDHCGADMFITNPPWTRDILHPMIERLSDCKPTWLLFDADWVHTLKSVPFLPRLRKIVAVGRVKWIEDSKYSGKDNVAWHLFDKPNGSLPVFVGQNLVSHR